MKAEDMRLGFSFIQGRENISRVGMFSRLGRIRAFARCVLFVQTCTVWMRSLEFKRTRIQLIILAVFGNQLLVVAALDDVAELEHHDNVCVLDSG